MGKNRYAMLTVDTEALPNRASSDHVKRLMWGEHTSGSAGIKEMSDIGNEVQAKHIFFVDYCGAFNRREEVSDVVNWLDKNGQDVQLHTHPEYLPITFWEKHGFKSKPKYLNQYDYKKAEFTIAYFSKLITTVTRKPVLAFRAGSFRWNADTIRALESTRIPVSFNNSMHASVVGQCTYSEPTNFPYRWSNGVIEVPITERQFYPSIRRGLWNLTDFLINNLKIRHNFPDFGKEWWRRLQYPSNYGNFPSLILEPYRSNSLLVLLMHSWSLLYWDKQGYGTYKDDQRLEGYRKLVQRISKDYDIINTNEFLELLEKGKIQITNTVDITKAEFFKIKE